jgi:hypothetical protein
LARRLVGSWARGLVRSPLSFPRAASCPFVRPPLPAPPLPLTNPLTTPPLGPSPRSPISPLETIYAIFTPPKPETVLALYKAGQVDAVAFAKEKGWPVPADFKLPANITYEELAAAGAKYTGQKAAAQAA